MVSTGSEGFLAGRSGRRAFSPRTGSPKMVWQAAWREVGVAIRRCGRCAAPTGPLWDLSRFPSKLPDGDSQDPFGCAIRLALPPDEGQDNWTGRDDRRRAVGDPRGSGGVGGAGRRGRRAADRAWRPARPDRQRALHGGRLASGAKGKPPFHARVHEAQVPGRGRPGPGRRLTMARPDGDVSIAEPVRKAGRRVSGAGLSPPRTSSAPPGTVGSWPDRPSPSRSGRRVAHPS
jgi:hypothetical protein